MKTLITILLLCSLCVTGRSQEFDDPIGLGLIGFGSIATQQPNANPDQFELLSTKGHESDFGLTECAVGITFLSVGYVVVVKLIDFCKKRFGTNQPALTNTHQIQRSANLTDWKLVGKMTWDESKETWEYSETNAAGGTFFYRITNYFGQ